MSELALSPAACYPLYPAIAARGPLPEEGLTLDTGDSYVFRREPSSDPSRMQIFHMREIVRAADRDRVVEWRVGWRARAEEMLRSLGLELELAIANDPFFGRSGRLLAAQQRDQELKWELLATVAGETPTAIASSNYHQAYFGHAYELRTRAGEPAHTACIAFGEERVTLALFAAHGLAPREWPGEVRATLALDS
jgi:seryl-tRNA synthetase